MIRRWFYLIALPLLCTNPVLAQKGAPGVGAPGVGAHGVGAHGIVYPLYSQAALLQGLYRHAYLPRAKTFAARSQTLDMATAQWCNAPAGDAGIGIATLRRHWQEAVLAWDDLSAVMVGPLITRRSQRQIDFAPTRPELIARAILAAPANELDMERIGTPAKGFPALEWLLWRSPAAPDTPACRYAVQLAHDIQREARAVSGDFASLALRDWNDDDAASGAATSELLNQWIGAIERLRWAQMERPLQAAGKHSQAAAYPRTASGTTTQSWAAQWQAIRSLGALQGTAVPQPGAALLPLDIYLRGLGLNPIADKLVAAIRQVDRALPAATPARPGSILAASRTLADLKRLAEGEVATAIQVQIGFSDADGD